MEPPAASYVPTVRSPIGEHSTFDISLVTDLPLFVDPVLLFNSRQRTYRRLHEEIIRYLQFLRDKADGQGISPSLLRAWYRFPGVRQNWLGFTRSGNRGSGLGGEFARSLHDNLHRIFTNFGSEQITKGSHLEKLCLIKEGVGRDNISDFATNLLKGFLCEYTEVFAKRHLSADQRRTVSIDRVRFNYDTEIWEPKQYELPWARGEHVLLTPKDLLTRGDTWINKTDLVEEFERLPQAIPDDQLRAQINNYFLRLLPRSRKKAPTTKERRHAAAETIREFPELIDAFIRYKEDHGDDAESTASEKVRISDQVFVEQIKAFRAELRRTPFYEVSGYTYQEAHQRIGYLKDQIENKGGHRLFYVKGVGIEREEDIHIMYRLCWFGTPSDVSREVNDGRGPADFKVSRGSSDKTIVEFKLAKNSQLKRNLEHQVEIYRKASDAKGGIKVIVFFSSAERKRVTAILKELRLTDDRDIVLVDARKDNKDNKPSGSKAQEDRTP
jgi:hypothetical protein